MSKKDRLLILMIIVVFSSGVFGYPYLVSWLHSDEGTITMKAFFFVIGLFAGIGLVAFHADLAYKVKKDIEKIEEISLKVEYHEEEIKMQEMRDNAERLLTTEELIHLENNRVGIFVDTKV